MLSGYCLNEKKHNNVTQFIAERAKSLLLPYLFFGVIFYIFWSIFHLIFIPDRIVNIRTFLLHLFINNTEAIKYLWGSIEWFLPCLFFSEILWMIIYKIVENAKLTFALSLFIGVVSMVIFSRVDIRLPLALDSAVIALVFFSFGRIMRFMPIDKEFQNNKFIYFCFLIITVIIVFTVYKLNGESNMRLLEFGNPFFYIIGAISGSIGLMLFSIIINNKIDGNIKKRIVYFGRNTLIILYLHRLFDGIVKTGMYFAGYDFKSSLIRYLFSAILIPIFFIVSIPLINFINMKLKFMLGHL